MTLGEKELKVFVKIIEGLLESNTYIVYNDNTKDAMIIDAGSSVHEISEYLKDRGLNVKHLVLTHGHYDHVFYIADYMKEFPNATAFCHIDEIKVLTNEEANVSSLFDFGMTFDYDFTLLRNGDVLLLGDIEFEVLSFPGHTPGSICLYYEKAKMLFTGDVLFSNAFGRTDFLYGSMSDMAHSIKALSQFNRDVTIYPGHGQRATLKEIFG